ncbi:MAG TPA: exodeoxyribonuclease VII large subunit [Casimicrobiaceae bacterium]|nr:exodeoxyribonuclease VII large subunit [Casimicrobiaceae bacterium]
MTDDAVRHAASGRGGGELPRNPSAVLPVSLFVSTARLLMERHLGLVWIGGEISGITRAASGHLYFTLKDSSAQVRCVFFRQKSQALGFALREGLAVEVRAVASIYEPRGEFQVNVETMRLAGMGALYERFLARKRALEAAGLFDAARKRALPPYPRRIGIVTSRHAAALRDVLTTLRRRAPGVPVILYPASVQGASAASEIAAAIRAANAHAQVDVLILCRGGGSLDDLWSFNEEVVARAVFHSRLPIVSGVGHETDFTICDFVADVRAATPTAAAALVVPDRAALCATVAALQRRLARALAHRLDNCSQRLDIASRRLVHPAARLALQAERARVLASRLMRAFAHRGNAALQRVQAARARLVRELRTPPPQARRVEALESALVRNGRERLARAARDVERLGAALALLNPAAVLDRGYAIVTEADGRIVGNAGELRVGDEVGLTFAKGRARATIKSTQSGGDGHAESATLPSVAPIAPSTR